ncbi:hypothetical protein M9H77_09120 [Catharanthus roseus]|uniref:Uncharacterized protein n=1 Tax=Catharanthus roseus TaxID=4058 RepID=A0ACC0BZR3_CATRO|nr:hypothetical protein M9H77_09120 [Catharanthus roseus]
MESIFFNLQPKLEMGWDSEVTTNVQILSVTGSILNIILYFPEKWQIENENLKALLNRARTRFEDANEFLSRLLWSKTERSWIAPPDLDYRISLIRKKLELTKLEVREIYEMFDDPWTSMAVLTDKDDFRYLVLNILPCIKSVVSFVPDSIVLDVVMKRLEFLRCSLAFTSIRGGSGLVFEKRIDVLSHVETAIYNIGCLLYLSISNINNKMEPEFEAQLKKIKPVQPETREMYIRALKAAMAESSQKDTLKIDEFASCVLDTLLEDMIELCEIKIEFVSSNFKDQILAFHQELEQLKCYTTDPIWNGLEQIVPLRNLICLHTNCLITETAYVVFSLYDEEMVKESSGAALSNLLTKFQDAKADIRRTYDKLVQKPPRTNFPRTNFQGFFSSFVQNLEEMVKPSETDTVVASVKHDIEVIKKELLCLRDDFGKVTQVNREHEELNQQWMHFNDVSYQFEYLIDLYVARGCPLINFKFGLFDVIQDIQMIRTGLKKVEPKRTNDEPSVQLQQDAAEIPSEVSSKSESLPDDMLLSSSNYKTDGTDEMLNSTTELVAFDEGEERILEQLTSEEKELQIISIVGMPGIGKTTLADSIYDHPFVRSCFHVRARVCVSKVYQRRGLFLDILQGVIGETENYTKKEDEELEEVLRQSLKGQRYLIFMDDIWDINPWLDIKASIPDDMKGSRIIFTSRFHHIASQAKRKSSSYQLDLLSKEKSWEMLCSKLFQKEESYPAELVDVGKEIAESCKGLPLTIDLIAGVLRIKERNRFCWRQVAKSIRTEIVDDPQHRCRKVLEQSYNDLPDHLKPCFLYFGGFPEDKVVPAKRLIWLWIAEGFIQPQKIDERIEDTAEAYLNQLIARSLVSISNRRSLGGVKASRIHDLLRDFACTKSEEELFLLQLKGQANLSPISMYDDDINDGYRMFFNSENWTEFDGSRSCSRVRSIRFYLNHIPLKHRSSLMFNFGKFRLLRVLDLQDIEEMHSDPSICLMVHLKFIALSAIQDWILSLLPEFQNLETILLVGRRFTIFSVDNIWNLSRLRHFRVGYCVLMLPKRNALIKSFQFANLLTLCTPCLLCDEEIETMMRRLRNLQRLSCTVFHSWDYKKKCNLFPKLYFLEELYSLKMVYVGKVLHPVGEFSFPPNLKRLTLSEFRLPWTEISTIAKLKQLEVLKLRIRAFEGEIWHMRDGDFPKLRILSLCKLDIVEWNTDEMEDELPPLEHLEVFDCKNLVELPFCLANIPTLKVIRLWQCSPSIEISAETIIQEQKANENEEIEIKRGPPTKTGWKDRMEFLTLFG